MFSHVPRIAISAALLLTSLNLAYAAEVREEILVKPVRPEMVQRSEAIAVSDLNLLNESGRATLMGRIHVAVKDVCGPLVDSRKLRETQDYHACYDAAMADATSKAQTAIASTQQFNESIAAVIVTRPANH